jgi:hypothetical protein
MALRKIPQAEWRTFFDGMADALVGKRVQVEAASLDLGDQIVAAWLPLLGVSYDPHDDLLDVALVGLDHRISHPREIDVEAGRNGIETVAILPADGMTQVLHLKDPLMLPAAERHDS